MPAGLQLEAAEIELFLINLIRQVRSQILPCSGQGSYSLCSLTLKIVKVPNKFDIEQYYVMSQDTIESVKSKLG